MPGSEERSSLNAPLLRIEQREMLSCPRRRQELEQIVKLKRARLAAGEDRLDDVWRD
ncbi:MAG: hypothetical protein QOF94_1245 [Acidobacteriaceae bacterium]|jgi:hypothetical protein